MIVQALGQNSVKIIIDKSNSEAMFSRIQTGLYIHTETESYSIFQLDISKFTKQDVRLKSLST